MIENANPYLKFWFFNFSLKETSSFHNTLENVLPLAWLPHLISSHINQITFISTEKKGKKNTLNLQGPIKALNVQKLKETLNG